jgi:hypothetical protein
MHLGPGCQRFVSQPQSVLMLTPNSDVICFRVFRSLSLYFLIFWPMEIEVSGEKKGNARWFVAFGVPIVGFQPRTLSFRDVDRGWSAPLKWENCASRPGQHPCGPRLHCGHKKATSRMRALCYGKQAERKYTLASPSERSMRCMWQNLMRWNHVLHLTILWIKSQNHRQKFQLPVVWLSGTVFQ